MICYHGTTIDSLDSIKRDRVLKASSPEISHYNDLGGLSTTYGYVYVTSDFLTAVDFAERHFEKCHSNHINLRRQLAIIRLDISERRLLDDLDEQEKGNCENCYRIKGDICIPKIHYTVLAFNKYDHYCDMIDYHSEELRKVVWKAI